jgi:hypothetical protein
LNPPGYVVGGKDRGLSASRDHAGGGDVRVRDRHVVHERFAMVFAQGLPAIIVFWAVVGGLGASFYLPAMQSLIHGNFEGKARAGVYALVGASVRSRPRSDRWWGDSSRNKRLDI